MDTSKYNPDTLVIYSSYEAPPDLFLFDSSTDLGKLAISCNGLVVNCEEEGFNEAQIDFVCNLSEKRYQVFLGTLGNFRHVISCAFAP